MNKTFRALNEEMNAYCAMPVSDPRLKNANVQLSLGICEVLKSADLSKDQKQNIETYIKCFGIESGLSVTPEVERAIEMIGTPLKNENVKTL